MSNTNDSTAIAEAPVTISNGLSRTASASDRVVLSPITEDPSHNYLYDNEEESWNFQKIIALILRRRGIIIGIFATIMTLTILLSVFSPRVYRSTAQVIINSDTSKNSQFAQAIPGLAGLLEGANGRSQDTEIQILQSTPVQKAALELLPENLRKSRINNLEIRPVGTTDLVNVSTSSTNPTFARDFTNKLCEAYVQQAQEESNRQYGDTAKYVNKQLISLRGKMDHSSAALRRYKEENGITDLTVETGARIATLKDLQASLELARVERGAGVSQLARLIQTAASTPASETAPSSYSVSPVVLQYQNQLAVLQSQLSQAKGEFVAGSPEVRTIEDQIKRIKEQLAREPKITVGTISRTINTTRQALDQQIATLRSQNEANSSRITTLEGQVAAARKDLSYMPQREFRLGQLTTEFQTYKQAFDTLSDKYQSLLVSQAAPVANAKILSPAEDSVKIKPNIPMNIVSGLFMAILFAFMGALAVDRMDNRIHSDDDIRTATHVPVLAYIPKVPHFETESLVALAAQHAENQHTPLLESYRMLRTSLMFTVLDSPLRCIMLTSSQPNEGKSSVAANLATVLAMNGKTVLLIDADLRRPSAHRLFGLNSDKGFSTVAAGLCTLEEAIQDTLVEGLRVLAVGPTPPNPPEMLDSRASRLILQRAREMADFVIIDAPPALMMADAQIIATEADGILMVVSWEEALKNAVAKTSDLLSRTGVKMLGVVVNKWDDRQAAYQNYYQKHYYGLHTEALEEKK